MDPACLRSSDPAAGYSAALHTRHQLLRPLAPSGRFQNRPKIPGVGLSKRRCVLRRIQLRPLEGHGGRDQQLPVQNHGFGGSADRDLMQYADELLYPYSPRIVVFQTGSNDYVQEEGTDAEKVLKCMNRKREMFAAFHEQLPDTRFVVMSGLSGLVGAGAGKTTY